MRSKPKESQTIGMGILFIILIIFLVVISVSFKVFNLIQESKFDGKTNYNLLYGVGNKWEVLSLSPSNQSIEILDMEGNSSQLVTLGIPYDMYLGMSEQVTPDNIKSQITPLLISLHTNPFDFFKIVTFVNSVNPGSIQEVSINLSDPQNPKTVSGIFSNTNISNENLNIEVLNATGQSGVGSYFAKMLTNIGGNVILVSTQNNISKSSEIITLDSNSQTAEKISKILGVKIIKQKPDLSDIKLVIGEDLLGRIR